MATRTESAWVTEMPDDSLARAPETLGAGVLRYGLALVLCGVGALKFTAYEVEGVHMFASHSPLLSWADQLVGMRGLSMLLGVIEISLGALIATRPILPRLSAIRSWAPSSCSRSR